MVDQITDFEEQERPIAAAGEELVIDVGGFEGPIDVLLTLARTHKVDITQISILELADQYLAWVARIRQQNLELAADYLVMAAWLAYLKSRLLLPDMSAEDEPTGAEMADALSFQLRRLEGMQNAGAKIFERPRLGQDFFPRGAPEKFGYSSTSIFDVTIYDLLSAYGDHTQRSNIHTLRIEPSDLYSPDEALKKLFGMIGKMHDWSDLMQFLPQELRGDLISRSALASTLAAALQLAKDGKLQLRQGENFGTVYIRKPKDSGNAQPQEEG